MRALLRLARNHVDHRIRATNRNHGACAVVLDIEGTVSPLAAVRDGLFPYARPRIVPWMYGNQPGSAEVAAGVRDALGEPDAPLWRIVDTLLEWHDLGRKEPPLKTVQGLIWQRGFESGELRAHIYPDVPPVLERWAAEDRPCYIYSSGSVLAQRLWFGHTDFGDLRGLLTGYFDGITAGPKTDPDSYQRIARDIGLRGPNILFLSDSADELDAAAAAGWHTTGVSREPDGWPNTGSHRRIDDFGVLEVEHA